MRRMKRGLAIAALGLACLGFTGCTSYQAAKLKAWTAPTWVYTSAQGRLELLNENAGSRFCLTQNEVEVCGTYSDNNSDVFSSAMAHFHRQPDEVRKPEKPSNVEFKPEQGNATWTWVVQPDGSFKDDKDGVWQLVSFRQFGRTYTE